MVDEEEKEEEEKRLMKKKTEKNHGDPSHTNTGTSIQMQ